MIVAERLVQQINKHMEEGRIVDLFVTGADKPVRVNEAALVQGLVEIVAAAGSKYVLTPDALLGFRSFNKMSASVAEKHSIPSTHGSFHG